jgi:DNA-binding CsgD family transcriptional regulator
MRSITKQARQTTIKRAAAAFQRLSLLPASVAILDAAGTIVAVNDAWKDFARQNGLRVPHFAIGSRYLRYCRSEEPRSRRFAKELRALLAGKLDLLTFIYPCHSPSEKRWFSLIGFPLSPDKQAGVALLHVNLTEMLPFSIGSRQTRANRRQETQIPSATTLDAISGEIERSVSEALSSHLNTMFTGHRQSSVQSKDETSNQTKLTLIRARLSKRQMQVLRLLGEGKTNKEMAKALFLSPNTVKLHVSAILRRLKLRSRTHAALIASGLNNNGSVDLVGGDLSSWKVASNPTQRRQPRRIARVTN